MQPRRRCWRGYLTVSACYTPNRRRNWKDSHGREIGDKRQQLQCRCHNRTLSASGRKENNLAKRRARGLEGHEKSGSTRDCCSDGAVRLLPNPSSPKPDTGCKRSLNALEMNSPSLHVSITDSLLQSLTTAPDGPEGISNQAFQSFCNLCSLPHYRGHRCT